MGGGGETQRQNIHVRETHQSVASSTHPDQGQTWDRSAHRPQLYPRSHTGLHAAAPPPVQFPRTTHQASRTLRKPGSHGGNSASAEVCSPQLCRRFTVVSTTCNDRHPVQPWLRHPVSPGPPAESTLGAPAGGTLSAGGWGEQERLSPKLFLTQTGRHC